LSIPSIKRQIDALSYNKMNTLHWHVVDAQSFPMQSQTYPLLAIKGAYNYPAATYTTQDVADLIEYGLQRGIRIVPEFDVPGHAASWGLAYPDITANCPHYEQNINNVALNPAVDETYTVVRGFFSEMAQLFPDKYFHTGGDEVVFGCWLDDPSIVAWMKQQGINSGQEIEEYFETKLQAIVKDMNKTMIVWQELFENNVTLSPSTIVHIWKDQPTLESSLGAGYRSLFSYGWYEDRQVPDPPTTHYEWIDTWLDFYNLEPLAGTKLPKSKQDLLLGGEAAMWSEQVDETVIDGRIWPRASAVAERLWSPSSAHDATEAKTRLIPQRCRMAQRGISAGPVAPGFCPIPPQ
jgi:hexosaminidase